MIIFSAASSPTLQVEPERRKAKKEFGSSAIDAYSYEYEDEQ